METYKRTLDWLIKSLVFSQHNFKVAFFKMKGSAEKLIFSDMLFKTFHTIDILIFPEYNFPLPLILIFKI